MSLPRPRPNSSGYPHSHWRRSSFLKAEGGTGTGSLERGQNWVGQKIQGFQGARKPCGGKGSLATQQAHPQGPWRELGGQPTHMPTEKNRNKPEQCTHTHTHTQGTHTEPHTDVQTATQQHTLQGHTCPDVHTPTGASHCDSLPVTPLCSCPLPVHLISRSPVPLPDAIC